jgi:hypothetical protein
LPTVTTSPTTTTTSPTTTTTSTPPTPTVPPSEVLVEVYNGTGAPGQATSVASSLHAIGFAINGTGDTSSFGYQANIIQYPAGLTASAQTLADYIGGATSLQVSSSVPPNEVQLITGNSFTGVKSS